MTSASLSGDFIPDSFDGFPASFDDSFDPFCYGRWRSAERPHAREFDFSFAQSAAVGVVKRIIACVVVWRSCDPHHRINAEELRRSGIVNAGPQINEPGVSACVLGVKPQWCRAWRLRRWEPRRHRRCICPSRCRCCRSVAACCLAGRGACTPQSRCCC